MYFQREQVISGHYGVFLSIALLHRGIKDLKKIGIFINDYEIEVVSRNSGSRL